MVVGEASIHNIMGGMENTAGVRLHNHKRKLKQRFDIIKKLGQGTYGKVQLGINKETGQEVAIKTIKKCKIETEADLIRIRREIQIMSSVQHPNIIHIYEVFENREKMVLVMEYAAGGELYDYLNERKVLTEHEARRIFRQIATAVFYCHKHKICHRDLKLENILLDQLGNAKIADFGLSNVFDEQRLLNTFCGSPLYASPEIVKGTPYHGPEVDCWSLGVLLYTLVYGAMPFDGSNFKRLVKQISQSDYFEPKKPSPASVLIKEMLTVCPARRADIEKICSHWWVNEDYEQSCLDIAEELAAQTPVRLDLLLSLVPQSASAEKLLVGDQQPAGDVANSVSSETIVPTRCHSVGSLMELDRNDSDRRIREMLEDETRTPQANTTGDAKRKLETTPSMDETASATVKKKDRSTRRKDKVDEREARSYRSTSRHHSAPIPNSITEEAMDVDPTVTVPTSKTADISDVEATAACLELIRECKERSPSKERSKTPVIPKEDAYMPRTPESERQCTEDYSRDEYPKSSNAVCPEKSALLEETATGLEKLQAEPAVASPIDQRSADIIDITDPKQASESTSKVTDKLTTEKSLNSNARRDSKKLKEKSLSVDSEPHSESRDVPAATYERRRSKIFETAEKFNQLASGVENEKPKKIFIPGVNVGGAKRVFERKASLSSTPTTPVTVKPSASKVIIDVPSDKVEKVEMPEKIENAEKPEKSATKTAIKKPKESEEVPVDADGKLSKTEEAKKRAVDIISGAIGKPPVQRKINGSPPTSPQGQEPKRLPLKIQVAPDDVRSATVSVTSPVDTIFPFDGKSVEKGRMNTSMSETLIGGDSQPDEPKMSSKMEITLKSATLPRPRKTSKAEISLSGMKSPEPVAFKSEVAAKIDAFQPQRLRTQRSEIAFPVAAASAPTTTSHSYRSSSLEPEGGIRASAPKERIIPIQVEASHTSNPPAKPPLSQRSMSQRSGSLSRQSTADSDTDSALGSTAGPEPIRKSPREYIIPIAVEGGGYVTPRSGSVEPESKTSTPTTANPPRSIFARPRRMSSLLSDASEDESPFSSLHRDSEDLLQRHMHRLRSSRPSRQAAEHADSLSSGEDDDDDGFELLTAENLFSTLLSRVRSLTQRLNVDDNRTPGFPSSRLFGRLGSNSPQSFWALNKPLSRRLTESPFKHSLSREGNVFARKDSANSSQPGTPGSPASRDTPSRDSLFDIGSNTLPRDKIERDDIEAETTTATATTLTGTTASAMTNTRKTLEQSFTPSLARRLSRQLSRQLIERSGQTLPRSLSVPYERYHRSPTRNSDTLTETSERTVQRSRSLLQTDRFYRVSPIRARRSTSLFDNCDNDEEDYVGRAKAGGVGNDGDETYSEADDGDNVGQDRFLVPALPRNIMTLGRRYKDPLKSSSANHRRENLYSYRTEKIHEEGTEESFPSWKENADAGTENGSISEYTSMSGCNSTTNLMDTTSSVSAKSYESSPTESSSNIVDYKSPFHRSDVCTSFESRLLAAENLIKESKLKNFDSSKLNRNLSSNYKETDKCEHKESFSGVESSMGNGSSMSKRRSCIPSLRLRSGSLTREHAYSTTESRRQSFTGSQNALGGITASPEKSMLCKFFGTSVDKSQKPKHHRISRFLRPDFFDTPREESRYVKEKEAQKAAENERRKSRFIKRKTDKEQLETEGEIVAAAESATTTPIAAEEKELKNELNNTKKDSDWQSGRKSKTEASSESETSKGTKQNSKIGFLQSLEKKLERLRSNEDAAGGKALANGVTGDLRENSAPPSTVEKDTSSGTVLQKKANSVEDLSPSKSPHNSPRSRVSSVLGLFKSTDSSKCVKQPANVHRGQPTLLSKFKKSPPKSPKSDTVTEDDSSPITKIPTKYGKSDSKIIKKSTENGKKGIVPGKIGGDFKRSPSKEKEKEKEKAKDKTNTSVESESTRDSKSIETIGTHAGDKKSASTGGGSSPPETDKKIFKTTKPLVKEQTEKEETDVASKKKRIVRAVKKVVKKSSNGSESKLDEKGKATKTITPKKKSTGPKVETAVEAKTKENDHLSRVAGRCLTRATCSDGKINTRTDVNSAESRSSGDVSRRSMENEPFENSGRKTDRKEPLPKPSLDQQHHQQCQRPNRTTLKLDFTKIPQHSFRNVTPKKDSPKTDKGRRSSVPPEPSSAAAVPQQRLIETLSKMTHHANITGNKIVIDKPLRAKDVAELKKEVTECARIIESRVADAEVPSELPPLGKDKLSDALTASSPMDIRTFDESTSDQPECLFSPVDEPESFDTWSVVSSTTELNHPRMDLHSPTSPTSPASSTSPSHSLFARNDQPESVIDRIRRRSFYSRFNDRKRPSLTVPPPGVITASSATLPRKFSFSGYRAKLPTDYAPLPTLHGDDTLLKKWNTSYVRDLGSPTEHHYGSLRRYFRSSTFDQSPCRSSRYHNTDLSPDIAETGSYRSSLSSLLNDSASETRSPLNSVTLPRKYGTIAAEPKTIQYYEELLAPAKTDYLTTRRSPRRSPLPMEHSANCENLYQNGAQDSVHSNFLKERPYTEKPANVESNQGSDEESPDRTRRKTNCQSTAERRPSRPLE